MKTITSLDELVIPVKHRLFLEFFLNNAREMKNKDKIERLILFGSCAKGEAGEKSDIDIAAIGPAIDDETLGELYYCAPEPNSGCYIDNDILAMTNTLYERFKSSYGMVQKYIEQDGVDISGLLQLG